MMAQLPSLYLAALLMDMSVAGVIFAITRRAAELGASPLHLGLLSSVWMLSYTIVTLVAGRVSDKVGRRSVAVAGILIAAVTAFGCGLTTSVPLLLGLTAVFGAGPGCFWPAIIAWIGEGVQGQKLLARLTIFGVAWNTGLLLGFVLTGILYQHAPHIAFLVSPCVMLLTVALLIKPAKQTSADEVTASIVDPMDAPTIPHGRGFRKTAWLSNFAITCCLGGVTAMFPKLATTLHIGAGVHGSLFALSRGAALMSFLPLHWLGFWRTRLWPLWVAQLLAAVGIASVGIGHTTWAFALAFVVVGAVTGYTYQASIVFTLEEMSEKGKGSGLHEAMVGAGMFAGPMLAGLVGEHTTLRTPYFFCAGLMVALVVVQVALVAWRRSQN